MTTVAWDGVTLAADTRGTAGNMPVGITKAFRLKDGRLYASSGDSQDGAAVRIWLENGGEKPTVKDFTAIVIDGESRIWRFEEKLVPIALTDKFHAIGSGRDHAMAAMHMGKSAREAVELAMLYDICTGGTVTELKLAERA